MTRFLLFLFVYIFFSVSYAQSVRTDEWKRLVPSEGISGDVKFRHANNNLDIAFYKGRYYVAVRTAPSHFASKKTKLYIISSTDFEHWRKETEFYIKADMREPRFSVFQDKLFFYFFEGGTNMFKFEPKHIWVSIYDGNAWAEKQKTDLDGFVNWRCRVWEGKMYFSAYYGVNLYNSEHAANLRLFSSEDGIHFAPISHEPQITTQGAEEGEFIFDAEGNLWATVRLEGSGSYLCYASKDSLGKWKKKFSKVKYDSALLLGLDSEIYLVARRNLKGDATPVENPDKKQRRKNMVGYSLSRKVTALFRINKDKMEIEHVMDFPSTGDTAFPGAAQKDGSSYYLLNYSSDINKKPKNWLRGQLGRTYIYWTVLHGIK
jgi:hypothetical protein